MHWLAQVFVAQKSEVITPTTTETQEVKIIAPTVPRFTALKAKLEAQVASQSVPSEINNDISEG